MYYFNLLTLFDFIYLTLIIVFDLYCIIVLRYVEIYIFISHLGKSISLVKWIDYFLKKFLCVFAPSFQTWFRMNPLIGEAGLQPLCDLALIFLIMLSYIGWRWPKSWPKRSKLLNDYMEDCKFLICALPSALIPSSQSIIIIVTINIILYRKISKY